MCVQSRASTTIEQFVYGRKLAKIGTLWADFDSWREDCSKNAPDAHTLVPSNQMPVTKRPFTRHPQGSARLPHIMSSKGERRRKQWPPIHCGCWPRMAQAHGPIVALAAVEADAHLSLEAAGHKHTTAFRMCPDLMRVKA